MGLAFVVIAMVGFIPSYRDMFAGVFPIHWFAHVHGAIMSLWLLVFITQSFLIAKRRLVIHRRLGIFSVILAFLVWTSMGIASFRGLYAYNPPIDNFLYDVLIMELYAMFLFGLFFTWAMVVRKKGAAHKRLVFFSTIVLLQAAVDRIPWLRIGLSMFVYLDILLLLMLWYDWKTLKRIHQLTLTGICIILVAQICATMLWGSPAWHAFWFKFMNQFR
jgi:hypothetical protein